VSSQRDQLLYGIEGELGRARRLGWCEVRGRDRNSQAGQLVVGDVNSPVAVKRVRYGQDTKAATEERMPGVYDIDLGRSSALRIARCGIEMITRWASNSKAVCSMRSGSR
jgi:hypothetical protein